MSILESPDARESFEGLLTRIRPRLMRVFHRYQIPVEDAEDVLQDTLLILLHKWEGIQDPERWMFGTLRKRCLMYWRSRRSHFCQAVDDAILDLVTEGQQPDQERSDLSRDLERALAHLSARCRSLLRLRYGLGYSPTEAADSLGYRRSSIRKVTSRCLAALGQHLMAAGFLKESSDV